MCVVQGVGVYVLQTEAACSPPLVFHQQAGKWVLIFPLEAFSELYHLHHP